MPALKATISNAAQVSKNTNSAYHETLTHPFENEQLLCSIYHSPILSYYHIYFFIPCKNGFEAITYDEKTHQYYVYHSHFFQRYAERFCLKHKSNLEILKHYLQHNPIILYTRYIKRIKATQSFCAVANTGNIYGYIDHANNFIHFRTIIDNFTLTKKKKHHTWPYRKALSNPGSIRKSWLQPPLIRFFPKADKKKKNPVQNISKNNKNFPQKDINRLMKVFCG